MVNFMLYFTTIKKKSTLQVAQKFFNIVVPTHYYKIDTSLHLSYPELQTHTRNLESGSILSPTPQFYTQL